MTDMQPGVEMDELIDEVVFGRTDKGFNGKYRYRYRYDGKNGKWIPEPYSTTWIGMQYVVEEMRRRGWNLVLLMKSETFGAGFSKGDIKTSEDSDSAPHAVCIAAIKALREHANSSGEDGRA
ncbi:hypothetical protein [Paenibacillus pinihumi]|uniref:hypothetical protein n=1 Tax=Paenibacillus pinihumi TaxID=669462 RepID=UPI000491198C|nr:hypothetical protein [Paenibacillus pinihumi]